MNEKQLAQRLASLKTITLSDKRKLVLKKKIMQEMLTENRNTFSLEKTFYRLPVILTSLLVVLVLLFSLVFFQHKSLRSMYYASRIAFTGNHYLKTKLVFEEATQNFRASHDTASVQQVIAETAETNYYISRLHLAGEKGKYTKEQCEQLYTEYVAFLGMLRSRLAQSNLSGYEAQILYYQQQAGIRMSYYKS